MKEFECVAGLVKLDTRTFKSCSATNLLLWGIRLLILYFPLYFILPFLFSKDIHIILLQNIHFIPLRAK